MNILVGDTDYGGLWSAAGLSSSSALVVASVIAIMQVSGLQIPKVSVFEFYFAKSIHIIILNLIGYLCVCLFF